MMIVHPATKQLLDDTLKDYPQGSLITGPVGVGLSGVVEYIGRQLKGTMQTVLPERQEKTDIEKGTITVDSIRRLYEQTKTTPQQPRIIVIDYAERMGVQAQNAFLKLLEEPPEKTYFILVSHDPSILLPTILSRVQEIAIRPIQRSQTEELLDKKRIIDPTQRAQLLFIAADLPAELLRLIDDKKYFEQRATVVRDARTLIQGDGYQALVTAQKYKDDRQQSLVLLSDAMKMLESSLQKEADERIIARLNELLAAHTAITRNGNIRLQLGAHVV